MNTSNAPTAKMPSSIFLISRATGVTLADILAPGRKKPENTYKQILCYLLTAEGVPQEHITEVAGLHRTTIVYSVKKIGDLISVRDSETLDIIAKINELKINH